MVDAVSIGNRALSHIGDSNIESLGEESAEANEINLWYDVARLEVLAAHNWSFARRRQALGLHGDDPPDEWSYRYQYPSDCIVARRFVNPLGPDADAVPFTVEMSDDGTTKSILTNLQDGVLVYTFDQKTPGLFVPVFVTLVARLLAHYVAPKLTGKLKIANNQLLIYNSLILSVPAVDANEGISVPPRDAPWVRGRV